MMIFGFLFVLVIVALFALAVFMAAVIGFPVAYSYTRRSDAKRNPQIKPDVFE